jgi:hypothetical protein
MRGYSLFGCSNDWLGRSWNPYRHAAHFHIREPFTRENGHASKPRKVQRPEQIERIKEKADNGFERSLAAAAVRTNRRKQSEWNELKTIKRNDNIANKAAIKAAHSPESSDNPPQNHVIRLEDSPKRESKESQNRRPTLSPFLAQRCLGWV